MSCEDGMKRFDLKTKKRRLFTVNTIFSNPALLFYSKIIWLVMPPFGYNKTKFILNTRCNSNQAFKSYSSLKIFNTSQLAPGDAREKFTAFLFSKVFSQVICLGFGVKGSGWQVRCVLRALPKSVWRSLQNLVEIGPTVRAWKRDTGTHIGT